MNFLKISKRFTFFVLGFWVLSLVLSPIPSAFARKDKKKPGGAGIVVPKYNPTPASTKKKKKVNRKGLPYKPRVRKKTSSKRKPSSTASKPKSNEVIPFIPSLEPRLSGADLPNLKPLLLEDNNQTPKED